MNRALWVVGGAAWFGLVFWVTLYLTFPGDEVGGFVARSIEQRTNGQYKIEIADARPWWVGLSAGNVIVSRVRTGAEGEEERPVFFADAMGVRIHPFALLRRGRQFSGYATMEESTVEAQIAAVDENGDLSLRRVQIAADGMEFSTLTALLAPGGGGSTFDGTGLVDLNVDLNMKDGVEKADGTIELTGDGVRLTRISAPSIGLQPMDLDVPITELDIQLAGDGGVLNVERGAIRSQLANVDLKGELTMADRVERSRLRMDVELELGDWTDTPLQTFKVIADGYFAKSKCDDGRAHYTLSGMVGHLSGNDFKEERCKTSSRPPRAAATPAGDPAAAPATPGVPPPAAGATPAPPTRPPREPAPVPEEPVAPEGGEEIEEQPAADDVEENAPAEEEQ
jgi:type II secretion system protein N